MRVWLMHRTRGEGLGAVVLACDARDFTLGLPHVPDLLRSGWNVTLTRDGHMFAIRHRTPRPA